MLALVSLALVLVAHVQAERFRGPQRVWRRDGFSGNSTLSFTNTSSTSMTSSTPAPSEISSTLPSPPVLPTDTPPFAITPAPAACEGSVTYVGSVYPTVFVTVTEGFEVTVTASNASITEAATLITPLPACEATVVPLNNSYAPLATIAISTIEPDVVSNAPVPEGQESSDWPPSTTTDVSGSKSGNPNATPELASSGPVPLESEAPATVVPHLSPAESASTVMSTIYATAPYTSTVIVTKKTPVPVVVPQTSAPPVFQDPNTLANPKQDNPTTAGNSPPVSTKGQPDNPPPPPSPNDGSNPSPAPAAIVFTTKPGTSTGLANIIASVINSPFSPAQPDRVTPATTLNNVPIAVGASSVYIGSQAVAVPTTGAATVRVGDQLFTVNPSEIIASGTTVGYAPLDLAQIASSVPATRVTAAPGLVLTVQGTTAIVAGTTYRIGDGASSTVVTVSGQRISIGPGGVGLPSTTILPAAITAAPMVVESVGDLTFSVDATEVVIDGTTFRIGSGAPTIRTTIDGQSLSIGPGGVGVGTSTTLKPTSVTAARTGTNASGTASLQSGAASCKNRIPFSEVFGWLLFGAAGILV